MLWPCVMPLYAERSNAHLIVTTDCTVSINLRNKSKDAELGKQWTKEIHLIAAQKFLSEVIGLSARNVDRGVCVTKLHATDIYKYLQGLLVAGNETDFAASTH